MQNYNNIVHSQNEFDSSSFYLVLSKFLMVRNKSHILFKIGLVFLVGLVFFGCKSTKYVYPGDRLLTKVEIKNPARDVSRQELKSYLRQQENLRILGFWKFHLGIYNLSGRDDSKGFNKWLRRIGEAPVIYDSTLVQRSVDQMSIFLKNRGYFLAEVSDTVTFPSRKKAKVTYTIHSGPRYRLNNVYYRIEDDSLRNLVLNDTVNSLLRRGRAFTTDLHNRERDRITQKLRNNGYYAFSREYIYFLADSSLGNYKINDTLVLMRPSQQTGVAEAGDYHRKYVIGDVQFQVGTDPQELILNESTELYKTDTIHYLGFKIVYEGKMNFRPDVLTNSNYINPGELYQSDLVERTQFLLSSLRLFKYINIRFREVDNVVDENGRKFLDCIIHVVPGKYQSYAVEIEGTNSSGNLGAAGNFKYQHKNLLNGAELFTLNTRLARQNQLVMRQSNKEQFNTLEFGGETSIVLPKFVLPFKIERFRQQYNPRTTIALAYNYQRRPDYTRTIANARLGYNWRSSRFLTHSFFPLDFNLVNIPHVSANFKEYIEDKFLKYTYEDHLIVNMNYSLLYNEQVLGQNRNFWYIRYNIESAGNMLDLMAPLWSDKTDDGFYQILGIRYAQYLKNDVDIRYHQRINSVTSITYRFFGGVGVPYGNLNVLPFEKRYFSGGANSVRAWPVRGLGPGSYKEENLTSYNYYNQTADIKLEFNVEYRFKLFWVLEGALFLDAGNIWSIRPEASVPGGLFKIDEFYKQMALGTGFGTRFDFKYFIFRVDTGLKLHDPSAESGKKWIPGSRPYTWNDVAFNFAIGYPF